MVKLQVMLSAVAIATTVVLQGANAAQAQSLTLDDFNSPLFDNLTGGGITPASTEDAGLLDFFSERDRVVASGSGNVTSQVVGLASTNEVRGDAGGSNQRHLIIYDGATDTTTDTISGAPGTFSGFAPGVDITNGNTTNILRITLANIVTPASANIDIRAISGSGINPVVDVLLTDQFTVSASQSEYDIAFSSFVNGPNTVDFTDLTALVIQFDNLAGATFEVDKITTVPEPATVLGTIGAILLGAGLAFKHRQRLKA